MNESSACGSGPGHLVRIHFVVIGIAAYAALAGCGSRIIESTAATNGGAAPASAQAASRADRTLAIQSALGDTAAGDLGTQGVVAP